MANAALIDLDRVEQAAPSEVDRIDARDATQALSRLAGRKSVRVEAREDSGERQSFVLPAAAVRLLTDILSQMAEGRAVMVMPSEAELTTQQAADILNVSRPHLIKLLEDGKIPHHKTGTHRRVSPRDLLTYRKRSQAARAEARAQLVKQAQELGMGY